MAQPIRLQVLAWKGMNRRLPASALRITEEGLMPPREALNVRAHLLPLLVPREALRIVDERQAQTNFPFGQVPGIVP